MSGKKTNKPTGPSYGDAAGRLEEILGRIEDGEVDIDELSGLVSEAAGLVTLCRDKIHAAEIQVKTITEQLERDAEPSGDDDRPADEVPDWTGDGRA
jgi:exodeoxyribonuclease VII small subunit